MESRLRYGAGYVQLFSLITCMRFPQGRVRERVGGREILLTHPPSLVVLRSFFGSGLRKFENITRMSL